MLAWQSGERGLAALALGEIAVPEPSPGEVLVAVEFAGLNFSDILMLNDKYQVRPPRPFVPGQEIAGVVVKTPPGGRLHVGQRIASKVVSGGFAQYALVRDDMAIPLPDAIPLHVLDADHAFAPQVATGEGPVRVGNRHPETYPCDSFSTRDGDMVVVCLGDPAFHDLARAIGRPDLTEDPRFATNAARNAHETELRATIGGWCAARSRQSAIEELRQAGVPSAPVWAIGDLLKSGDVESRALLKRPEQRDAGSSAFVTQPVKFSGAEEPAGLRAPALGEHTERVLASLLGLDAGLIASLRTGKAIATPEDHKRIDRRVSSKADSK